MLVVQIPLLGKVGSGQQNAIENSTAEVLVLSCTGTAMLYQEFPLLRSEQDVRYGSNLA